MARIDKEIELIKRQSVEFKAKAQCELLLRETEIFAQLLHVNNVVFNSASTKAAF